MELVTLRKSGLTCEELAARFGTAKSTISGTELVKLECSILKEVRRNDNWGCPSIYGKSG